MAMWVPNAKRSIVLQFTILAAFWSCLGASWGNLGLSWNRLVGVVGCLEPFWRGILRRLRGFVEASWRPLGPLGGLLDASWGILEASWAQLWSLRGLMLAYVELCWGILEQCKPI